MKMGYKTMVKQWELNSKKNNFNNYMDIDGVSLDYVEGKEYILKKIYEIYYLHLLKKKKKNNEKNCSDFMEEIWDMFEDEKMNLVLSIEKINKKKCVKNSFDNVDIGFVKGKEYILDKIHNIYYNIIIKNKKEPYQKKMNDFFEKIINMKIEERSYLGNKKKKEKNNG
jgi:uncharacterized protein (DUF2164 family)